MTKTKSIKSAMMLSALAMLLCVSLLVGSTFAWFTDSVQSNNNIIKSGNLDAELYWSTDATSWTEVTDTTNVFSDEPWEPGHTEVIYFKLVNAGSLAFKYNFGVNVISETASINVENKPFVLSDYIKFGIIEQDKAEAYADRDDAVKAVADSAKIISTGYSKADTILATDGEDAKYLAMVVYMPTSVGNEANYKTGATAPEIKLGISLFATQYTKENDSFGDDYDETAPWTGMIDTAWYENDTSKTEYILTSAEQLAGLAKLVNEGNAFDKITIKLGKDIDLNNVSWTPIGAGSVGDKWIGFNGYFDGQNHTVSNLKVTKGGGWNGLFGLIGRGTSKHTEYLSNVTIKNASIIGANRMSGAVVGQIYGNVENCHVENVEIVAIPNWTGNEYDNGDKIGGVIGWFGDNGNNHYIKNCSAKNVNLKAYRDVAGIVGYIGSTTTVENCSVDTVNVIVDQVTNHYGVETANAGGVVGRIGNTPVTVQNNTETNVTINTSLVNIYDAAKMGSLYEYLPTLKKGDVLILPEQIYITTGTLTIPDGVTIKGAEGAEVIIRQTSAAQDDIFNCVGDAVIENITFESNRKGYAIAGNTKEHDTNGDITVINCKFKGIAAEKNYGVYKNLYGDLIIKDCTFDNYNNAVCGVNNGGDSTTVITGCTFTNINGEAIGYVSSSVSADFESGVIANNTGLTAENVIGY